jgi:hypothetical protein
MPVFFDESRRRMIFIRSLLALLTFVLVVGRGTCSLEPNPDTSSTADTSACLKQVARHLAETQTTMKENVSLILERGESLKDLCAKTERLSMESKRFMSNAEKLSETFYEGSAVVVGLLFLLGLLYTGRTFSSLLTALVVLSSLVYGLGRTNILST